MAMWGKAGVAVWPDTIVSGAGQADAPGSRTEASTEASPSTQTAPA